MKPIFLRIFLIVVVQILSLGSYSTGAAEPIAGQLQQQDGQVFLKTSTELIPLELSPALNEAVVSLVGKSPFVAVVGQRLYNGRLEVSRVPTMMSGDRTLEGKLNRIVTSSGEIFYEINGLPVDFGQTKLVNGASFDEDSRAFYVGKNVRAQAQLDQGVFVIQSIIRSDMFSASPGPVIDANVPQNIIKAFSQDPLNSAIALVRGDLKSPSPIWFKQTLFGHEERIEPSEPVLIITVSGSESDSMGAVNGHFATGLGRVGDDMQIRGELFNVYVTNEKQIEPGDVKDVDYFGHLISGQNNYRPTYTFILYGVSQDKILQLRAELDHFYPFFRSGSTKITADKNCVTLSVQALADIGIYGVQRDNPKNPQQFLLLSEETKLPAPLSKLATMKFLARTKRSEFMPGPAVIGILENLQNPKYRDEVGVKRIDMIFGGQIPSSRPIGRAPTKGVIDELLKQVKIGADLLGTRYLAAPVKRLLRHPLRNQCESLF